MQDAIAAVEFHGVTTVIVLKINFQNADPDIAPYHLLHTYHSFQLSIDPTTPSFHSKSQSIPFRLKTPAQPAAP